MYRGTTPSIVYKLDTELDLNDLTQVWVTIESSKIEMTKDITQVSIDDTEKTITVPLSQDDTLQFKAGKVKCQMRLYFNDTSAYATPITELTINDILKDGVING